MNRIPCGALLTLQPAERAAVEEQMDLALIDLGDAIEDMSAQYRELRKVVDYVLYGKREHELEFRGMSDLI